MLVLTRTIGENVKIGNDIVVSIEDIRSGEKVRLGIEAPKHVSILRGELDDENKKPWWTVCGYNGNENVVLHIRADSAEEAAEISQLGEFADFIFVGKLNELTEKPVMEVA